MAESIHASAVVAPGARVGQGCTVGPYCVVGPQVTLGDGCVLHSHVVLEGKTSLGPGCEVFPFACIGGRTQDLKYTGGESAVEIGAKTTLREYVTVHAATTEGGVTRIGDNCSILAYCHIAHDCVLKDRVIMSNGTMLAGHVTVEDAVVFGGMAGVHQFVRIGTMAMVSATSKVVQDVVPFCLVDGNPAQPVTVNRIGMERNGRDAETIRTVSTAYRILFRTNLKLEDALERLRAEFRGVPDVQTMATFVAESERGVARPRGHREL